MQEMHAVGRRACAGDPKVDAVTSSPRCGSTIGRINALWGLHRHWRLHVPSESSKEEKGAKSDRNQPKKKWQGGGEKHGGASCFSPEMVPSHSTSVPHRLGTPIRARDRVRARGRASYIVAPSLSPQQSHLVGGHGLASSHFIQPAREHDFLLKRAKRRTRCGAAAPLRNDFKMSWVDAAADEGGFFPAMWGAHGTLDPVPTFSIRPGRPS